MLCARNPYVVSWLPSIVIAYFRQFENPLQQTVPRLGFSNVIAFAVSWGLTKKEGLGGLGNVTFQAFLLNAGMVRGFQIRKPALLDCKSRRAGDDLKPINLSGLQKPGRFYEQVTAATPPNRTLTPATCSLTSFRGVLQPKLWEVFVYILTMIKCSKCHCIFCYLNANAIIPGPDYIKLLIAFKLFDITNIRYTFSRFYFLNDIGNGIFKFFILYLPY